MIHVLDASAMIAFLRDERGADVVAEALLDPDSRCYAHALNLCEVFYDFHRAAGPQEAAQALADLARLGVAEDAQLTGKSGRPPVSERRSSAAFHSLTASPSNWRNERAASS